MFEHTSSSIAHLDISGPELGSLAQFYASVLHWSVTPRGEGYSLVETPEGSPNAALIEAESSSIVVGIAVPDLDASIALAVAHGGSVTMAPLDNGWVRKAQVSDPAGNLLTLIQQ